MTTAELRDIIERAERALAERGSAIVDPVHLALVELARRAKLHIAAEAAANGAHDFGTEYMASVRRSITARRDLIDALPTTCYLMPPDPEPDYEHEDLPARELPRRRWLSRLRSAFWGWP
jgi:hypothetical protein